MRNDNKLPTTKQLEVMPTLDGQPHLRHEV
jgi:hypothetical protein